MLFSLVSNETSATSPIPRSWALIAFRTVNEIVESFDRRKKSRTPVRKPGSTPIQCIAFKARGREYVPALQFPYLRFNIAIAGAAIGFRRHPGQSSLFKLAAERTVPAASACG